MLFITVEKIVLTKGQEAIARRIEDLFNIQLPEATEESPYELVTLVQQVDAWKDIDTDPRMIAQIIPATQGNAKYINKLLMTAYKYEIFQF